jgi:hypothetical protein
MKWFISPTIWVVIPVLAAACEPGKALPTEGATPLAASSSEREDQRTLVVDQSNLVTDHLGLGNGLYGQTFAPRAKNLAQVDLSFIVNQVPPGGVVTTVGIFTDITQPPLATAQALVAAPAPGELFRTVSFQFNRPVKLKKGRSYLIGAYMPATLSWEFAFGDAYPAGQVIMPDGTPLNPIGDFVFTTYQLKNDD